MLKPYMHGYFVSLKLYDAARVITNPFAYAEHREKLIREKMDKLAETRIRSKKVPGVKINKGLAEKILKEEEREKKREERRRAKKPVVETDEGEGEDAEMEDDEGALKKPNLLNDPRFAKVFEDPEFAIDETSREYALLNPSAAAQNKGKTAAEDEEEESDKAPSSGLGTTDSESGSGSDEDGSSSDDSSDAGGTSSPSQSYFNNLTFVLQRFNLTSVFCRIVFLTNLICAFPTSILFPCAPRKVLRAQIETLLLANVDLALPPYQRSRRTV